MLVDETNLKDVIQSTWRETLEAARGSAGANRAKAKTWVDCLAEAFQARYEGSNRRVFWRGNSNNRDVFDLNELLFDISVCKIEWVSSISGKVWIPFVAACDWHVESELNDANSREITKDFSKLVMGCSENKLFVSSYLDKRRKAAETLCSTMATRCEGNLFLCFIPHPRSWDEAQGGPEVLKWSADHWSAL